ncbi:hypothetical protein B5807_10213 [Epicoccum nigrum]|uniref:Uncharacterized protein n=1 Tax=Epicoccum nigrum TaxID=105696 RepID=A0A1Y2LN59_EPING|nr:hypothetical protein B5807_10213 [Epicoccum nigrum]
MDRLRIQTSRFVENPPNQNEMAANGDAGYEVGFSAGNVRRLRKKRDCCHLKGGHWLTRWIASRFLRNKIDVTPSPSPSPSPPPTASSVETCVLASTEKTGKSEASLSSSASEKEGAKTTKPLPALPCSSASELPHSHIVAKNKSTASLPPTGSMGRVISRRPSFASLRRSSMSAIFHFFCPANRNAGSRIFHAKTGEHEPPPPPLPQICVNTFDLTPKANRVGIIRPFKSARSSARSSRSTTPKPYISQPVRCPQPAHSPSAFLPITVSFTRPPGPPPPRPPRPESIDDELLDMILDGNTRMVLPYDGRSRSATVTTTSSTISSFSSEDSLSRLGLSGHSSLSAPRTPSLESPLAAGFPRDPNRPLPRQDSNGELKGYSRFSEFVRAGEQHASSGYGDGVDPEDRELGPIEVYRASKCGDWVLEKRVSGRLGERGMLFKDRWGGWHFVLDI